MNPNLYPTSNTQAQKTHAAWDAAPCMDDDQLAELEYAERMRREREAEEAEEE